jgi:hypothetical protein
VADEHEGTGNAGGMEQFMEIADNSGGGPGL